MGLDIKVLANLKSSEVDGDGFYLYNIEGYKDRNTKFPEGEYKADVLFRAHNFYGKYGYFRTLLAQLIGAKDQEDIWGNPDKWQDKPFYSLINFPDNEGSFDFEVAEKLANDFKQFAAKAESGFDEYNWGKYQDWQNAFELAAQNKGVVVYS